jgi:hypothetical protein
MGPAAARSLDPAAQHLELTLSKNMPASGPASPAAACVRDGGVPQRLSGPESVVVIVIVVSAGVLAVLGLPGKEALELLLGAALIGATVVTTVRSGSSRRIAAGVRAALAAV